MSRLSKSKSSISLRAQSQSFSTPSKSPSQASRGGPSRSRVTLARPVSKSPTKHVEAPPETPTPRLSVKEQIALRRAEAKKAQAQQSRSASAEELLLEDPTATLSAPLDELADLGRWTVRETIERAKSTGNLNLSSRLLLCIPTYLFESHLGVTPAPLKLVTEPELPAGESRRARTQGQAPSWYETQDLVVLKAGSNEIVEVQPELSLFGSLKTIDLHSNQIVSLPASLTTLSSLTVLDLSNNKLTEIPPAVFSLPELTTLNLSHNQLGSLPFSQYDIALDLPSSLRPGGFFEPAVNRATEPLPKLHALDLGHNKLTAAVIDSSHIPRRIRHLTLSHNTLGHARELLSALASLRELTEAHLDSTGLSDNDFESNSSSVFPKLQLLDLGETQVHEKAIRTFFAGTNRESELSFDVTTSEPRAGELRTIVGRRVVKEQWEIEAEQRYLKKKKSIAASMSRTVQTNGNTQVNGGEPKEIEKDPWAIEAEQGLMSEAARRRARAAAAAKTSMENIPPVPALANPKVIKKEAWEIEAEQGLLTEGGRRRARALQAQAQSQGAGENSGSPTESPAKASPALCPRSLESSSYYSPQTLTLTLPPSAQPSRSHARAFSLVATPQRGLQRAPSADDLIVPSPSLPLQVIASQGFAEKLRVLILSKRRADPSFHIPADVLGNASGEGSLLPNLDELYLDGCGLGDNVYVTQDGSATTTQRLATIETLSRLFPKLSLLDLSYNAISSDALTAATLTSLLIPSPQSSQDETAPRGERRKGLKALRLRGNRISGLEGFEEVASLFKGNRQVQGWGLEELDIRDNEISKLPVLLGFLPLDVFLVDGNTFRIPARKVWEREGTKGLLSWLRGRIV